MLLLSEIEQGVLFKESINSYGENGPSNGLLFLTEQTLFFYESERKYKKYEFPLEEIVKIEYGKVFRHITGCIITLKDGNTVKFGMSEKSFINWEHNIKYPPLSLVP